MNNDKDMGEAFDPENTPNDEDSPTTRATGKESAVEPVGLTVMSAAPLTDFWDLDVDAQREWARNFLSAMAPALRGKTRRPPVSNEDGQDATVGDGGPESDPGSGVDHEEKGPR